jgi:cytochrome c
MTMGYRPLCPALLAAALMAALPPSGALAQPAAEPAARGRILFLQCRACHGVAAGEPHKVGPNLHGILGAAAASRPGFASYSAALKASGLVWTEAELDRFLAAPGRAVPGTSMAFAGMERPADRAALIAYLREATR